MRTCFMIRSLLMAQLADRRLPGSRKSQRPRPKKKQTGGGEAHPQVRKRRAEAHPQDGNGGLKPTTGRNGGRSPPTGRIWFCNIFSTKGFLPCADVFQPVFALPKGSACARMRLRTGRVCHDGYTAIARGITFLPPAAGGWFCGSA